MFIGFEISLEHTAVDGRLGQIHDIFFTFILPLFQVVAGLHDGVQIE